MWETSSLASSQWKSGSAKGDNVGKGRLFYGKVKSDLTIDKLNAMQNQSLSTKPPMPSRGNSIPLQINDIKNQYHVTTMNNGNDQDEEDKAMNSHHEVDDDDDDFDRSSQQSKDSHENDMDDEALMRIGKFLFCSFICYMLI